MEQPAAACSAKAGYYKTGEGFDCDLGRVCVLSLRHRTARCALTASPRCVQCARCVAFGGVNVVLSAVSKTWGGRRVASNLQTLLSLTLFFLNPPPTESGQLIHMFGWQSVAPPRRDTLQAPLAAVDMASKSIIDSQIPASQPRRNEEEPGSSQEFDCMISSLPDSAFVVASRTDGGQAAAAVPPRQAATAAGNGRAVAGQLSDSDSEEFLRKCINSGIMEEQGKRATSASI